MSSVEPRAAVGIRPALPFFLIFVLFAVIAIRLFQIQVIEGDRYEAAADKILTKTESIPAARGRILDHEGRVLAFSRPVEHLIADPVEIKKRGDPAKIAQWLGPALSMKPRELLEKIQGEGHYRIVKKKLSSQEADTAKDLLVKHHQLGFTFEKEYQREYPFNKIAAQLIGYCGIRTFKDENGKEKSGLGGLYGIEARYDKLLRGVDGYRNYTAVTNPYEPGLYRPDEEIEARPGADIYLTLDGVISTIAEDELGAICEKYKPQWASAIVMDPNSGEILAMEQRPQFDPNQYSKYPIDSYINRSIAYAVTPGSSMKPFIMTAALEEGLLNLREQIDCENGLWAYKSRKIHDHEREGLLTPEQVIAQSSNIGMAKIGLRLGIDRAERYVQFYGFGRATGVELPGEAVGWVTPRAQWSDAFTLCSVSFGHEISVTPMRLSSSFAIFANSGELVEPRLLNRVIDFDGRVSINPPGRRKKVVSDQALPIIRHMLEEVMISGTGKPVASKLVKIAGKTGTTVKDQMKDGKKAYTSVFVGYAPAEAPRLLVTLIVDEPKGAYYGSQVAAPAAVKILERSLKLLHALPGQSEIDVAAVGKAKPK